MPPKSQTFRFNPSLELIDFILKPGVGVTFVISSLANCFNIVVFPELSSPINNILSSLSDDDLNFLSNDNKPYSIKKQSFIFL